MAVIEPITLRLRDAKSLTITAAGPEHASGYLDLAAQLIREGSYGTVAGLDDPPRSAEAQSERFIEDRHDPDTLQLVALNHDGKVVGEARCQGLGRHRVRHVAKVSLAVASDVRGLGLGEHLMRLLIGWAIAHPGIERLTLAVFEPNLPARRLYEKLGFAIEGRRVAEIKLSPTRYADDLIMARWVKPQPSPEMIGGLAEFEPWRDSGTTA